MRELYRRILPEWEGKSAVESRLGEPAALLDAAAHIAHEELGIPRPKCDPWPVLRAAIAAGAADADQPLLAYRDLLTWAAANRTRFYGSHEMDRQGNDMVPVAGWAGTWAKGASVLSVRPDVFRELMRKWGHDPTEVLTRWAGRGWLVADGGRRTQEVSLAGTPAKCYQVRVL